MSIRTLIVDDTVTYRKILSDIVGQCNELQLAGTASTGGIALKKLAQSPVDLVLLDVVMPDMDGLQTLEKIKQQFLGVYVVMVSGVSRENAAVTIRALELGAVDFIRKPDTGDQTQNIAQLTNDIRGVIRLVQLKMNARPASTPPPVRSAPLAAVPVVPAEPVLARRMTPKRVSLCVIGVSTGGPEALTRLVPAIDGNLPIPILLVQHMPPLFTRSLAESLSRKSALRVVEACDGDIIGPGTVYIAPGGRHMVVREHDGVEVIGLNDEPPENSCRPSVDVLFRSVAACFGDTGVLSVILTGMGSDGLAGVRALKRKSCYSITQAESTCVVYGMPRSIDEAGLSDVSLPLEAIAAEINQRAGLSTGMGRL